MSNYLGQQEWVRASVRREGEGYALAGLGGAFDTGNAVADALIANADATLSALLRPAWPAIDSTPLPADQKELLKQKPVTFYLQLFGAFENLAAEIITTANALSGKQSRTIGIPGVNQTTVSMVVDQPQDMQVASPTGRHVLRVLRIANAFMILVYQAPQFLAQATAQVLFKYGVQGYQQVAQFVQTVGTQAAAHAQQFIATGTQVARATGGQNVAAIVQTVVQNVPPLPTPSSVISTVTSLFHGLGQTGAEAGVAAEGGATVTTATATGATTGVASTPVIATLITGLLAALLRGAAAGGAGALLQQAGGAQQPPPAGQTAADGQWVNGQWVPKPGPLDALKPYALPLGALLVGGLVIAAANKK